MAPQRVVAAQHPHVDISQVSRTFYLERSSSVFGLSFQVVFLILEVFDSRLSLRLILLLENGWNLWMMLIRMLVGVAVTGRIGTTSRIHAPAGVDHAFGASDRTFPTRCLRQRACSELT